MIRKYSEFILEDLNKSKSIIKNKMDEYEKLKTFLNTNNNMGYLGKFTEFLFNGVPSSELMNLYNQLMDFKKKNIKVNINEFESYEKLLDDINRKIVSYKFKSIFNQFPKEQKEMFGDMKKLSKDEKDEILTISKLADIEDASPFMRKISRYKNKGDLIKACKRFLDGKIQTFDREYVKSLLYNDLRLVFENDDILIVRTIDFDSLLKVGSDTSWCIASSKSTFNSYVKEDRTQFVLFDYTKGFYDVDFKIGFTLDIEGKVIYSHDILDRSCVAQVREILVENKVDVNAIGYNSKSDATKFTDKTSLKTIENAIKAKSVKDDETFKIVLHLLSQKLLKSSGGSSISDVICSLFIDRAQRKGEPMSEAEFDKYQPQLISRSYAHGHFFSMIKTNLINKHAVLTSKAPDRILEKPEQLLKNYKNWDFKLNQDPSIYIKAIKDHNEIVPAILYFAQNTPTSTTTKIVTYYCQKVSGEQLDLNQVKSVIDEHKQDRFDLYNKFGIKYKYNQKSSYSQKSENIIPSKVIIKDAQARSEILPAVNCDITLEYGSEFLLGKINYYFKLYGRKNEIQRRRNYEDNATGNFIEQILNPLRDKLTASGRREIIFDPSVTFPIEVQNHIVLKKSRFQAFDDSIDLTAKMVINYVAPKVIEE